MQAKEAARAALSRADGSRVYGAEEHKEREREIERDFLAQMDRIDEGISERVAEAEEKLLVAQHRDPTRALTAGELAEANQRRVFVGDEVHALPADVLAWRARAAIASGDRPGMFLLSLAAARRAEEELELGEVVAELRAGLDPEAERRLAAARQAHEEAQGLQERAYLARRGATDAYGLYSGGGGTGSVYSIPQGR